MKPLTLLLPVGVGVGTYYAALQGLVPGVQGLKAVDQARPYGQAAVDAAHKFADAQARSAAIWAAGAVALFLLLKR